MKELVERLFQVDFLKGMRVTFKTQHPDNIYTEQYPAGTAHGGGAVSRRATPEHES